MSDQDNLKKLRKQKGDSTKSFYTIRSSRTHAFALASILIFLSMCCLSMDTCQAVDIENESSNISVNNTSTKYAAGSEPVVLNKTQILYVGKQVANFIEKNKRLPSTVSVGNTTLTIAQFAYVSSAFISGANEVTLFDVELEKYWILRLSTSFTKSQYLLMAQRTSKFMYNNHKTPSYVGSAKGNIDFYNMVYVYAKALRYYKDKGKLPNTVTLSTQIPWNAKRLDSLYVDTVISSLKSKIKSTKSSMNYYAAKIKKTTNKKTLQYYKDKYNSLNSKYKDLNSQLTYFTKFTKSEWYVPASLRVYLKETKYAQINNPNIVVLSSDLSSGSTYDTANNIFLWVRDNIEYQFYYKTKYGATGTLKGGNGNCVDQAHLIVALARSAGIPARYVRGYCYFMSGHYYAHVWAQLYVKGYGWVTADPTHYLNTFGTVRNWNASKSTIYGTLVEYSSS